MKIEEKLVDAYNTMMKRVHTAIDEAEEKTIPTLEHNLEEAKVRAIELGELTREEAEKVTGYLKRDVEEAARYLQETGDEFSDWIQFDYELIEDAVKEAFMSVADQTKLQLEKLSKKAAEANSYHTGEISGIGTLVCENCGEKLHFKKTGHIPPCPKCHATRFKRG
jgi:NADH pyrophosphatase NudC (nudix superfamily)